jgi:hypothetical protein
MSASQPAGVEPQWTIQSVVCPCNQVSDFPQRCYLHQPLQFGEYNPDFSYTTVTSTQVIRCLECGGWSTFHRLDCSHFGPKYVLSDDDVKRIAAEVAKQMREASKP